MATSVLDPPAAAWAPRFWTPSQYHVSDGPELNLYAESLLHVAKGRLAGQPLRFAPWQQWLSSALLERRPDGRRRFRRGIIGLARKNGKSLFGSALGLHALTESDDAAEIYACAGDRQQARILFNEAKWQVAHSPALRAIIKPYRDVLEVPSTGAVFRVLSADAKLQQGLNPSLVLFDEVHVQPSDDLWDAMNQGSGARIDPLVVGITTAGFNLESLLGRLYLYGLQVARGEVDDPSFGLWWWEAEQGLAHDDPRAWAQANPNLAEGLIDLEDLVSLSKPGASTEFSFRRFRLNQWVRAAESWLPSGAWEACEGEPDFDPDLPVWVGVDMALKHDSVAVVACQPQPHPPDDYDADGNVIADSRQLFVQARIWLGPGAGGSTIDVVEVENHLRELHRVLDLQAVAYDPAYFVRSAQVLEDDGLPMLEHPQSSARMVPAAQSAYRVICTRRLVHPGMPTFTDQVLSAATRQTDEGWRLSKGRAKRKMDAAIALAMAVHLAVIDDPAPPPASAPADTVETDTLYRPAVRLKL